jgi:isopentenyl diphosphate isomerase/L-lactate dehydrogenase-like FMN-dependent dehydrogenase
MIRSVRSPGPLNVADYEALAAERLDDAAYGYFAGGAGDERTLADNVEAWGRLRLLPRVLVDVGETSAATTVLGEHVSAPVVVAPTAFQRLAHPEGETAMARAAAAAGTVMCLSTLATATPEEVGEAVPGAPWWYQVYVYRRREVTWAFVERALESGCSALVLTVDLPVFGRRERDLRTGFAIPEAITVPTMAAAAEAGWSGMAPQDILIDPTVSWRDLEELCARYPVPVLVKGVLGADDGRLALEHGAAGVVVSNHGGRQLDGVPATADVLEEVADAVGKRGEVLVDGGIRRGTDVLRALALGARAALVGRAPLWGLAAGGEAGARDVLELLRAEVEAGLALLGCPRPDEVRREHVTRVG